MENQAIRSYAKQKGVKLWQIAERLGINDGNFSRKLRRELPESERLALVQIVDELAMEVC